MKNALKMKRQSEQNDLHSYEIDERLSVSETQGLKREAEQDASHRVFKAEQQAQQTQQVLAKYQQRQQKSQMKGGNGRGYESGIGSFASKYQPPSVEEECPAAKEGFGKIFYDGELVNRV